MMRYNFHPDARAEYLEAISFYNERQSGLGTEFTLEFESAIGRILETPTRWRIIEKNVVALCENFHTAYVPTRRLPDKRRNFEWRKPK